VIVSVVLYSTRRRAVWMHACSVASLDEIAAVGGAGQSGFDSHEGAARGPSVEDLEMAAHRIDQLREITTATDLRNRTFVDLLDVYEVRLF
jgi:hypothetical protein